MPIHCITFAPDPIYGKIYNNIYKTSFRYWIIFVKIMTKSFKALASKTVCDIIYTNIHENY